MEPSYTASAAATANETGSSGYGQYDRVSIWLHWLTAALIFALFLIAETWGFLDRANRGPLKVTHTSLGVLLTATIVGRLVWRVFFGHAVAAANAGWARIAAKLTHGLFYLLIATQVSLGFLAAWSGRRATVSFFGLQIPSPFPPFTPDAHHLIEEFHGWIGWTIIILALGHAVTALFHHYVLRDNLMARMSPWRS